MDEKQISLLTRINELEIAVDIANRDRDNALIIARMMYKQFMKAEEELHAYKTKEKPFTKHYDQGALEKALRMPINFLYGKEQG